MNLGFIAHNSKKSLMEDFCVAYQGILSRHTLYATGTTGRRIEEATGLKVHKLLAGSVGGDMQFTEMIERNGLDLVVVFYNPAMVNIREPEFARIIRACDQYCIPLATNIATAEALILALDRGDLDWRMQVQAGTE